jgi:flavin reductase (DIM6/NTAB) family NADH-FMN oxidoreductase RutF
VLQLLEDVMASLEEVPAGVGTELFRRAMRRLAASVCIVTTVSDGGERRGATVTAVSSVAAEPPTLLCCLNQQSNTQIVARQSGRLAVNILPTHCRELAAAFAGPGGPEEKFRLGDWTTSETGSPLLADAVAAFDCRVLDAVDIATHTAFFCRIVDIQVPIGARQALLYAEGEYGHFVLPTSLHLSAG